LSKLLSRDDFREGVFLRDGHSCVLCHAPGQDAHHIVERRLFGASGGYFLDNGVTVCGPCHIRCERTEVSCDEVRTAAGIKTVVLPDHLYSDTDYDKWGNPILANGMRLCGELFQDESVQKALSDCLHLFTDRVKYPRTFHLPWSPGKTEDDKTMADTSGLEGEEVVVTAKLDGENTSFYADYIHARSLEYASRIDRDRIRALHASIAYDIPVGWRVCGENVWAEHSISYRDLDSIFYVFGIWNDKNTCLPWDETLEWTTLLGLQPVPVLYRGPWNEKGVRAGGFMPKPAETSYQDEMEGYVVRVTRSFRESEFRRVTGKFVRKGHVRTQAHWTREIRPNPFVERL